MTLPPLLPSSVPVSPNMKAQTVKPQHISPDLFNKTLKEMLTTRRTILQDESSDDSASRDSKETPQQAPLTESKPVQQIVP